MKTKNLIRTIYVYLATFIGLMMIVIPMVDMFKLGLETWVFPLASENMYEYDRIPPEPYALTKLEEGTIEKNTSLTEDDRQALQNWKADYKSWQEKKDSIDWKKANLQRDLVRDLSTMIVGLALFLTHGYILRRDRKRKV